MQLSPSTVPSDSNMLAGIFPVGASMVAAEGPGLAEPAGFAELMAALAPTPAAATPITAQPQPAGFGGCGGAVADLRVPGLVARVEGEAMEDVDGEVVSIVEAESEAAPRSPATRTESSSVEEQPVELPRLLEPRRSLHEPVAGLETLIVPQVAVAPAPVAEDALELDEEPAELDTEEAPLDEDDSTSEETAEDAVLPVARELTTESGRVFAVVEPRPEIVRSSLHSRQVATQAQAPVSAPTMQAALTESAPLTEPAAASATAAMELPRVDAKVGKGTAKLFVASDTRESAMTVAPLASLPVTTPIAAPVSAREVFAQTQAVASETAPTLVTPGGPASSTPPTAVETLARAAVAEQPVRAAAIESSETLVVSDEDAREQVLPPGSAGTSAEATPLAPTTQHEIVSRAAAPRVAAAYATREKFAANRMASTAERFSQDSSRKISFLNADNESVVGDRSTVGIDVAKSETVMPALSTPATFASVAPLAMSVRDVASSPVQESPELGEPQAVSNAEQAVEVVLRAVDTAADREQKFVKLEFSVGDTELSVRVELAANEVRTTFRTESPELRAALAHEWQAVSADSTEEGGVRLAPAVIADKEHSPSTSADANSQRQERQAARQEEASASAQQAAARSLLRSTSPADAPAAATPAFRALAPAGTAQRLHLFA